MRNKIGVLFFAASMLAGGQAFAGPGDIIGQAIPSADDLKWVNKCIVDNRNEGAKPEVVKAYCECMNSKMDDNETRSIDQWEKTHPKERKECEVKSGWK